MHHHYQDITAPMRTIGREPRWWDENGVPRYSEFSANDSANIYADEVVLMRIECQGCGTPFDVCMTSSAMKRLLFQLHHGRPGASMAELIKTQQIHYGDPPNTNCCPAGATMNSIPVRVLEYWTRKENIFGMKRVPELEVTIEPDWVKE